MICEVLYCENSVLDRATLCAQSVPARGVHTQDGDGGRSDEGRAAEVASKHVEHVVAER